MSRTLAALLAASVCLAATAADDWPAWRGPSADGVAPAGANPPVKWDASTNVLWKTPLTGRGSASPVVWGDRVFVLTSVEGRAARPEEMPKPDARFQTKTSPPDRVYRFEVAAYSRDTGKELWRRVAAEAVPHEGHHPTHSYAAGSPATDGVRLYASFGSFGVYAYSRDGDLLWKHDLGRLRTRLGWGEAVTPVAHAGSLVLNGDQEADSRLIVLDAATGQSRWEAKRDEKSSWNTPLVVAHAGKTQVVVNGTNRVRAYDLANGDVIWETGGMTVNAIPSPVASGGVAYVMSGYRGAAAVAVPLNATGELKTPEQVSWRFGKGTPYVPSPLLYEGRLYFTQGNTSVLTVLDAKTGKPLSEPQRLPVGQFYASPVAAGGHLYFVDRDGTTVVLKPGDEPEVVAVNKLGDPVDASPAVSGDRLILRGEKYLWCLGERP